MTEYVALVEAQGLPEEWARFSVFLRAELLRAFFLADYAADEAVEVITGLCDDCSLHWRLAGRSMVYHTARLAASSRY